MAIVHYRRSAGGSVHRQHVPPEDLQPFLDRRTADGHVVESLELPAGDKAALVLADVQGQTASEILTRAELARTDLAMARVTEDLFAALKAKGVLVDADLPQDALDRMAARAAKRGEL